MPRPSQRQAVTKFSPQSNSGEQKGYQVLGDEQPCADIKECALKDIAHRPPTPLSDGPGTSDPGYGQLQSVFTLFDMGADADQHCHTSSLNDPDILEQWPLIDTIDLEHWDPRLASPPDEPARLTSTPQGSVLPSGPNPANEVSQQSTGLTDILRGQDNQSIVEPASPTTQPGQPPAMAIHPGNIDVIEASPQPECRCLQPVVFLIDELEAGRNTVASQGLDASLASHKEALRYGQALIECQRCRARPEHMTILKFLTDKLAGLSEQIVAGYTQCLLHPAAGATGSMAVRGSNADRDGRNGSGGAPPWPTVLGSYEVDSAREWDTLIGGLIGLQLEALHSMIESMKVVSRSMRWDAMYGRAAATQRRIVPMLYRIQSLCRPGGGTVDATVFCDPS